MLSKHLGPIARNCYWLCVGILVATMASLSDSSTAVAQGMGNARVSPLKVVIMLGPEFDFKKAPFTNASEIRSIFPAAPSGSFVAPTLDTISVDVETPIPQGKDLIVVATYPSETKEEDLQKLKRSVQLNALRFGINHVEMVAKDYEESQRPLNTIWLRVPANFDWNINTVSRYAEIAVALAQSKPGDLFNEQARIDVYPFALEPQALGSEDPFDEPFAIKKNAQNARSMNDPFVGGGAQGANPFGGGNASDDPFGGPTVAADPFGSDNNPVQDVVADTEDPFSGPPVTPQQKAEKIASEIAKFRQHRESFREKIKTVILENEKTKAIELAKPLIALDIQAQKRLQILEILQLELKVSALKAEFNERQSPESLKLVQEQRLEKLFGPQPK